MRSLLSTMTDQKQDWSHFTYYLKRDHEIRTMRSLHSSRTGLAGASRADPEYHPGRMANAEV